MRENNIKNSVKIKFAKSEYFYILQNVALDHTFSNPEIIEKYTSMEVSNDGNSRAPPFCRKSQNVFC